MEENIKFKQTSYGCPEQYDILYNNENIGYIRLRWGYLKCIVYTETIYEHEFDDNMKGILGQERDYYLNKIKQKVNKYLQNEKDI